MIAYRSCKVPQIIQTGGITLGIVGVEAEKPRAVFLPERQSIRQIQYAVSAYYGVRWFDLVSERRSRSIAWPRQVAMYLCRELTPNSLPRIGHHFGGRDHTTVMHAIRAVEKRGGETQRDLEILRKIISAERMAA